MRVRIYGPTIAELHTVQTNGTDGSLWVSLPDIPCASLTIFNDTGVTIAVKYNAQTAPTPPDLGYNTIPTGASRQFWGLSFNGKRTSAALSVRRKDVANTASDVGFQTEILEAGSGLVSTAS